MNEGRLKQWCRTRIVVCSIGISILLLPVPLYSQAPVISPGSVVNAASYSAPIVAGSTTSLYGTNLASAEGAASTVPYPATLLGTTVRMNGIAAPLIFVSPGQINFQAPWELAGQPSASVTVTTGAGTSAPVTVGLVPYFPGIYTIDATGGGIGLLQRDNGEFISLSSQAIRGETLRLLAVGLGAVTNRPASGNLAAASPASDTVAVPAVTVGGVPAQVTFSRFLSEPFPVPVGSYEVGFIVPATAPVGTSVPLVVTIGGATSDAVSIPVAAGCSYSISSSVQSFSASGGNGSVNVITTSGCAWTAVSNSGFVTVTAGASGSGNGTVEYAVAANSGPQRTGTLTIAGNTFTVTQAGGAAGCTYSISPANQTFPTGGGTGSVSVVAASGCGWTAASNASFLAITSGSSGSGNGTVDFAVEANPSTGSLRGTLTIAGQTFAVVVEGTVAPPSLSVSPGSLSFSAAVGASPAQQSLQISSSGTLNWAVTVTILNGSGWLTATPTSGVATAVQPSTAAVEVNYNSLTAAGVYQAEIAVQNTAAGGATLVIPVTVTVSEAGAQLLLSRAAFVFRGAEGGAAPPAQTLEVFNGGQGSLNWSIPADLAPWLTITPLAGSAGAGVGTATTVSVNPTGLAAGVYQVVAPVSAPGAVSDQQFVTVTLQLAAAAAAASGAVSPSGMVFVAQPGSGAPAAQGVTVSNTGGGSLSFAWQATTTSGGNWLSVSPANGDTAAGPATAQVAVNPAGLSAGLYRGKLTGTFTVGAAAGGAEEVEVVLVVAAAGTGLQRALPTAAQCAGGSMDVVLRTIGTGSVVPVSLGRPLLATVVNTCGEGVSDATVVATVELQPIALAALGDGQYSGTWVPRQQADSVPISVVALHPDYARVDRTVTVSTEETGALLPVLFADGVVEAAAFTRLRPLAPGSIVSLFGERFAETVEVSTELPLKRSLAGVNIQIDGKDAPLYSAGAGQVNAQLPYDATPGKKVSVTVKTNGKFTTPQNYLVTQAQPNIFLSGDGWAVLDVASNRITPSNPAHPGDVLVIYATGLGETDPPGETGEGAPGPSRVVLPVTVKVGGEEAVVQYAGLAPSYVGLYQVNVVVPATVTPGASVEIILRQNGIRSNPDRPVTIPVQ